MAAVLADAILSNSSDLGEDNFEDEWEEVLRLLTEVPRLLEGDTSELSDRDVFFLWDSLGSRGVPDELKWLYKELSPKPSDA